MSYKYNDGPFLFQHLSFQIRPGEIVGMHGFSGTGKTTLSKLLAGYMKPVEGEITIGGHIGLGSRASTPSSSSGSTLKKQLIPGGE